MPSRTSRGNASFAARASRATSASARLGITRGEGVGEAEQSIQIEPMFSGIAQILGVLKAIDEGICDPATVDEVIRNGFGLRLPVLGPVETADMIGLDLIGLKVNTATIGNVTLNRIYLLFGFKLNLRR